jgi:signal transduction histidine kinase
MGMQNIKADTYKKGSSNEELNELLSLIDRYAQGDFSEKISVSGENTGYDELFDSLNLMVDRVRGIIRGKEEAVRELSETREKLSSYKNHFEYKVALRTEKLKKEIFERRKVEKQLREREKRIEHLNSVLRSIKDINHLIIKEKDRKKLIDSVCRSLVENRGYNSVWIILVDEEYNTVDYSEAEYGNGFSSLKKIGYRSELPECVLNSLKVSGIRIIDKASDCGCCQYNKGDDAGEVLDMAVRLEYGGKVYGVLHGHLPGEFALIGEEQKLFSEIARDIAYSLYNMELLEERTKTKQELIEAKEKAEEGERLKSAFLGNISHEVRTPMNGIMGFINFLKDKTISEEDREEYIDLIEDSGVRLLNLINDLMDMSKIESGQLNFNSEKTNINQIMKDLYFFYEPQIREKGLDLSYKVSLSEEESFIFTDGMRLKQVLTNLLDNAIKFTDSGSVYFGYTLKDGEFEFFVRDTGKGLYPENQGVVFHRFMQEETSRYITYEGVGLGLSICKYFVEMLGGNIWIDSHPGKGATFYFTLPYLKPSDETYNYVN